MNSRKTYFFIALIIALSVMALLVTGSPLLNIALDSSNTIPIGTFIAWAGMIAFTSTIYWGVKELRTPTRKANTILSKCLKLVILLAILWVPISYLLAGDLSFTFSETQSFQGGQTAMKWFWRLSYGIGIGGVLILMIYWITLLFKHRKH